jgi:hypothetical protein
MATIAVTALTANSNTAAPTQTASGTTNIVSAANIPLEEIMLKAVVTTATTVVTIKAGDYPPALSAGQGDAALSLTVGTHYVGPFTSGRFVQSDGTLNVDVATAANVTLAAIRLPRTA